MHQNVVMRALATVRGIWAVHADVTDHSTEIVFTFLYLMYFIDQISPGVSDFCQHLVIIFIFRLQRDHE